MPSFWEFSCLCVLPHYGITEVAHTHTPTADFSWFEGSELRASSLHGERAFYPRHHTTSPLQPQVSHFRGSLQTSFSMRPGLGTPPPIDKPQGAGIPMIFYKWKAIYRAWGELGLPEWPFLHLACSPPPPCRWLFPVSLSEQKFTSVEEGQGLSRQTQHPAHNRRSASLNSTPSRSNGCPWHM